jgi:hypothetical protein
MGTGVLSSWFPLLSAMFAELLTVLCRSPCCMRKVRLSCNGYCDDEWYILSLVRLYDKWGMKCSNAKIYMRSSNFPVCMWHTCVPSLFVKYGASSSCLPPVLTPLILAAMVAGPSLAFWKCEDHCITLGSAPTVFAAAAPAASAVIMSELLVWCSTFTGLLLVGLQGGSRRLMDVGQTSSLVPI